MYSIVSTSRFKRDLKRAIKQRRDLAPLDEVVTLLASGAALPARNRDHALTGDLKAYRECHIAPDFLLIYRIEQDQLILSLSRLGTHSDLLDL